MFMEIVFYFYVFLVYTMAVPNDFNLELVQVIFRHGARTSFKAEIDVLKHDIIDKNFHEYYGYGQLTNKGKRQTYNLGSALRDRYNDFLGETYHPENVYARSTDFDRTKMSLELVLAGLYPPVADQVWNPDLKWIPIPFEYQLINSDILLLPHYNSIYQKHLMESQNLPEVKKLMLKYDEFAKSLLRNGIISDKIYQHLFGLCGLHNVIHVYKTENLSLPDKFTENMYETLKNATVDFLDSMSWTKEMKRFNGGPLLKKCLENIKLQNKTNNKKIYLYSAHDLTVSAFLSTQNLENVTYPDFSNAVIIEKFRSSQNQLYIRILNWNGKEFVNLKKRNFEELCLFDEYVKSVEDVIPSNEELKLMSKAKTVNIVEVYIKEAKKNKGRFNIGSINTV